jgi:hypothetical protein
MDLASHMNSFSPSREASVRFDSGDFARICTPSLNFLRQHILFQMHFPNTDFYARDHAYYKVGTRNDECSFSYIVHGIFGKNTLPKVEDFSVF